VPEHRQPGPARSGGDFNEFAINTYGWFQKAGVVPVKSTATVAAAAAVGLTGAGTIGANTAGKQILGYIQLASQTGTKTFANTCRRERQRP
jgi:hypothetical protein